jgi:tRNA pseudouridine13 synthase
MVPVQQGIEHAVAPAATGKAPAAISEAPAVTVEVPGPLGWPRTHQARLPTAVLKRHPEDFQVVENLRLDFTGSGEHLYLFVEKRGLETRDVAGQLAAHFGVSTMDVGFAGLKDKRAVARQWFSVPTVDDGERAAASGFEILQRDRHDKKLRRGAHAGNTFEIRLREIGNTEVRIRDAAPNYFGKQRFGVTNLDRALNWLWHRRQRRVSRTERGWHLSVLRSYLFNEVLGARVLAGNWQDTVRGDVVVDCKATGPLWGRGRSGTTDTAADLEQRALAEHQDVCEALEYAGARQGRRPLAAVPTDLKTMQEGDDLVVGFTLETGMYATSFLSESFVLLDEYRP